MRAPFSVIIFAQILSTIGDIFGQRASRVVYRGSQRRFLIAINFINVVQAVLFLLFAFCFVNSYTRMVMVNNTPITCTDKVDLEFNSNYICTSIIDKSTLHTNGTKSVLGTSPALPPRIIEGIEALAGSNVGTCNKVECPSQGLFFFIRQIIAYPVLLTLGLIGLLYYIGNVFLLKDTLGMLLVVIGQLFSSFIIDPLLSLFGYPNSFFPIPVYIFAVFGAILCTVDFTKQNFSDQTERNDSYPNDDEEKNKKRFRRLDLSRLILSLQNGLKMFSSSLFIIIPFLLYSLGTALSYAVQKIWNDKYHVNAFSFFALDKLSTIVFITGFLLICDFIPMVKQLLESSPEFSNQSLKEVVKYSIKDTFSSWTNFFSLFIFRFMLNIRSVLNFFLAVLYDPGQTYLTLTLIRVVMSWVTMILLSAFIPSLIGTSLEERKRVFSRQNILIKMFGTTATLLSLVFMKKTT